VKDVTADSEETQSLLARVHGGDQEAADRLFTRHRAYLRQVVDMRLDDRIRRRVDASDVVQATQLEATRRLADYLQRRPMPFRLWLRKTAHEHMSKMLRQHAHVKKRSVQREMSLPPRSSLQLARELLGSKTSPSEQVSRRELTQFVRQAVAKLGDDDREIVLMMNFEGLSSREVGQVLDLDPSTVCRRHGRALLRLHKILLDSGISESQI